LTAERRLKRVTLAEVARAAQVSQTTASLVLNNRADELGISQTTRAAVRAASARLGYRPNRMAQSLGRQRTDVLTLLVQDLANPWFIDLAVAARSAAEARGLRLNVVGAGPLEAELSALEGLRDGSADGVIVATGRHGGRGRAVRALLNLVEGGLPAVLLIDRSPAPAVPAIRVDVEEGAAAATRHLLALGHRRIAHLSLATARALEDEEHSAGDRYRGYRRALADAGVATDPAWVLRGPDTLAGGRALARALLALPQPRPTAALVYNDVMAIGVLRGLHEQGARVPDDVAVVGTDDIAQAEFTVPALTTIHHPAAELGRRAIETVAELLAGTTPSTTDDVLEPRLVVRESCGATARSIPAEQ
jgi:DNA-binding LacI/PurR family transcriptional regulator